MKWIYLFVSISIHQLIFATDYSKAEHWASLPDKQDAADWVPANSGLKNNQDSAQVDVFYIHPTTDLTGFSGNASLDDQRVNKATDEFPIQYQASVFNGSCKIYAPRYRQAVLNNFFKKNTESAQQAFDTAYKDIKDAFEYYLKHYNNGRPIIIAGHSQGSKHAQHLLQDFFDGTPLQKQLVEAYIIGYPTKQEQFIFLKVSEKADTFGGYISYCTFGQDAKIDWMKEYNNAVVVNPLSWKTDKIFVSAKENKGSLDRQTDKIITNVCGAKCSNGILEIQKPESGHFTSLGFKNYHLHDYGLFYINIRQNVALRIQKYMENQKTGKS